MWDKGKYRRSFPGIFLDDQSSCARRTLTISFNSPALPENTFIYPGMITIVCVARTKKHFFPLLVRPIHTLISRLAYHVIIVAIVVFLSTAFFFFLQDLQDLLEPLHFWFAILTKALWPHASIHCLQLYRIWPRMSIDRRINHKLHFISYSRVKLFKESLHCYQEY